jgi:hypothetical protein
MRAGDDVMKDFKEREQEARERLKERLARLRVELARRPVAAGPGGARGRAPLPRVEPEQPTWWWQR